MSELRSFDASELRAFGSSTLRARGGGAPAITQPINEFSFVGLRGELVIRKISDNSLFGSATLNSTMVWVEEGVKELLRIWFGNRRHAAGGASYLWKLFTGTGISALDTEGTHPGWTYQSPPYTTHQPFSSYPPVFVQNGDIFTVSWTSANSAPLVAGISSPNGCSLTFTTRLRVGVGTLTRFILALSLFDSAPPVIPTSGTYYSKLSLELDLAIVR